MALLGLTHRKCRSCITKPRAYRGDAVEGTRWANSLAVRGWRIRVPVSLHSLLIRQTGRWDRVSKPTPKAWALSPALFAPSPALGSGRLAHEMLDLDHQRE